MRKYFLYAALVLAMSIPAQPAFPAIRMPGVFGDNMVVRHGQETRIWGRAAPGEWVTVDFAGKKVLLRASENGQWDTWVGPVEAGGPYELKVRGTTTYVVYKNVMAGDVWVAGGQSNMEWAVSQAADAAKEIEAADYPEIRFLRVPKAMSWVPADDTSAPWKVCSPETAGDFSAVAYYYARELYERTGIPQGIIDA
ncbi:MAG: hypothetical protein LUE26_08995 [Alistipes sp.]|nr:hypothetical protein [Alistipes sp.]